jgi:hypothetical protein
MVAVIYEKGNPDNVIAVADKGSNAVVSWIVITISALVIMFGLLLVSGTYGFVSVPTSTAPATGSHPSLPGDSKTSV